MPLSNFFKVVITFLLITNSLQTFSQLKQDAMAKIAILNNLIDTAELQNIPVDHEKSTVRTAEIFIDFADWDEANTAENQTYFEMVGAFKDTAAIAAQNLPDFERRDVILMLDKSIAYLNKLINGDFTRKNTPVIDWSQITQNNDALIFDSRPIFTSDYTWKPAVPNLQEFYGAQDGFYISPTQITNNSGTLQSWITSQLNAKPTGNAGFIFINNKQVPDWAETEYGPGFRMRQTTFTGYDIDNPGAKELYGFLFKETTPKMSNKNYTSLGYMLCNEPHFFTDKAGSTDLWASGPVSDYTKAKFKDWLITKHTDIATVNGIWNASYADFDALISDLEIPMDNALQGEPKWYDWVTFNNYRVTEYYTWMKSEIQKPGNDPSAKVHLKIMPLLWSENRRSHGIDMEALTRLSDIIGNDVQADYNHLYKTLEWESHYAFGWREMAMSYDFYKSISPEKIMYNSESHFLSTGTSRFLGQDPLYARATYWYAHTLGLTGSQTWLWARNEDGSIDSRAGNGYAASNNQQPRVVNEVTTTMLDLNTFSEEVMAFQRARKPLRIFYSETSATNKSAHMDDVFELYEDLNFDGISLGFATKDIIANNNNSDWDAILIYKTEFVTEAELLALQTYLDNGGSIIKDAISLTKDEYGATHSTSLTGSIQIANTSELIASTALQFLDGKDLLPDVTITETGGSYKGCTWKIAKNIDGKNILSIINLAKDNRTIDVNLNDVVNGTALNDLIRGVEISKTQTLKPYQVLFVEVEDKTPDPLSVEEETIDAFKSMVYPNPSTGKFNLNIPAVAENNDAEIHVYNTLGRLILSTTSNTVNTQINLSNQASGIYFFKIITKNNTETITCFKK